jgi:hypothetical protein
MWEFDSEIQAGLQVCRITERKHAFLDKRKREEFQLGSLAYECKIFHSEEESLLYTY